MCHQHIQPRHPIWYINCSCTLWYPLQNTLLNRQETLNHNSITHHHKVWHLKEILCHTSNYPIRYQTYQTTWIQNQVCHIILYRIHLTHEVTSIINFDDVQKTRQIWSKKALKSPYFKIANIIAKLLTTEYKSRVIKFKLNEDTLQHQVYFLS